MFSVPGNATICVLDSRQLSTSENPFRFNRVLSDMTNEWNRTTHSYTMAAMHGIYLVAWSVGAGASTQIAFTLMKSDSPYAGITSTRQGSDRKDFDTIGREIMVDLTAADRIHVSSGHGTYSSTNYYTSLSIFSVTDAMGPFPVAFSVARDQPVTGFTNPVAFNIVLANEWFYFDTISHRFSVPITGTYYFSFSVGLFERSTADFVLYVNEDPFVNIIRSSTVHSGTDTIGRSIMMNLNADDTVHIVNNNNQLALSSEALEISFSGFLYSPAHGTKVNIV